MAKPIFVAEIDDPFEKNQIKLGLGGPKNQNKNVKQNHMNPINTINKQNKQPKDLPQKESKNSFQNKYDDEGNKDMRNKRFQRFHVNVIHVVDERPSDPSNQDELNLMSDLDSEKKMNIRKSKARKETFESILQNQHTNSLWIDLLLYPCAIILFSSLFLVPFCFFPAHDLVKHPDFWYEILFHGSYFVIILYLTFTYQLNSYLNVTYFYHARPLIILCLVGQMTIVLFTIFSYFIWTRTLSYQYPIPFCGLLTFVVTSCIYHPTIWYLIPNGLRKSLDLRKRIGFFIFFVTSYMTTVLVYQLLAFTVEHFRGPYQPVIALIFPFMRELTIWMFTKIIQKCANGDERKALIVLLYQMNINHTINLCYIM